ncbi:uncharacterized protein CANTADRAFT_24875 [Suhomyces tanzawaensis NRRL Y-17324]|uniref:Zinc finger CHCC-type domain-containing protein n=1 Tax=Suhomyces tanzawaensis NRRL Y-17324 TaxID=984487 RepID=A0A1E4SSB2_9ASCO|nr:uncharacterized protein CANTADRAFT_24875 [Suhomyces tanzawaensis NRRL Y-17324]ODV82307.1 hypothetical protein CANTADRAFT_24875 [Suhomyces tanzawaensis NRRL Y-17324]
MLSSIRISLRPTRLVALRFQSSVAVKKTSTGLSKDELKNSEVSKQAPNRAEPWSASQESRLDVITKHPHRFVQRDLELQPRPYAAIDLIAQEPVRYLSHDEGNIAVCDGNRGSTLQGHPKVFINLDQAKPNPCGYCGLRYAKEEFREVIEAQEAHK